MVGKCIFFKDVFVFVLGKRCYDQVLLFTCELHWLYSLGSMYHKGGVERKQMACWRLYMSQGSANRT